MTVNAEKFQYENKLRMGEETLGVRSMLPYEQKERMA